MYLSRFGVKNYKCLGEIDVPLTPIHVLIGENDAGKSSLLEAMAAFYASSDAKLADAFPQPWTGRELVRYDASDSAVPLSGLWETSPSEKRRRYARFRYSITVAFPAHGTGCICTAEAIEVGKERHELLPASQQGSAQTTIVARWRAQSGKLPRPLQAAGVTERDLSAVSDVLRPTQIYSFDPRVMALPAHIDTQTEFRLERDGFGLSALLAQISSHDATDFVQLQNQFCEYFRQFKTVQIPYVQTGFVRRRDPNGSDKWNRGFGTEIRFVSHSGETLRAQQVSDGAILFLGFLALAHLPKPPNLLLIEEPENGIYPKRLGEVIKMLKHLVTRTEGARFPQIIFTTHSPYVLSFFEPEEVTFLSRVKDRPDGAVRARPLRDAPNIKERMGNEFYLGELWYNLSEEDLFGEP